MSDNELLERVQRLEDRHAIEELVWRYCLAIDATDFDSVSELFAAEARFAGERRGEEVVERLRAGRGGHGRTIHTPHGQILTFVDADHATGIVPTSAELGIEGKTILSRMRYDDEYVREDGSWRFARRRIKYQYALPNEEMGEALTDDLPVRWPGAPAGPPA